MNYRISLLMMTLSSIAASAQLTIENTTPGTPEYSTIVPRPEFTEFCSETDDLLCYDRSKRSFKVVLGNTAHNSIPHDYRQTWITPDSHWNYNMETQALFLSENGTKTLAYMGITSDYDLSLAGRCVAYHKGDTLFVQSPYSRGPLQINDTIADGLKFGTSVHRDEFGIEKGIFWSPDGSKMAFYRMDERMVTEYPMVMIPEVAGGIAHPYTVRYPMAGGTSHKVSIGILDVKTNSISYLRTEGYDDNRYLTNLSWSPDNKTLAVAEVNRGQNHMWFNLYDTTTGKKTTTLFEEKSHTWVEPCTPALFIDEKSFLWLSERDGYLHIYKYDINTGNRKQLTKGKWCVTELIGYDHKRNRVIFQANKESYLCRDIYAVGIKGGQEPKRLSFGEGMHRANYMSGKRYLVDIHSSLDVAVRTSVIDLQSDQEVLELSRCDDPYKGTHLPSIKFVDLKSANGVHKLTGRIILPPNFIPSKKYPVLVYLYGGSHTHLVDKGWLGGASPWMLYLAQEGYIVWTMDNRGSENRGVNFEHCTHRQLGTCESEDKMVGINYLRSLGYVDTSRIAIHGWSFGGFMTLTMLTKYPEVFKVGIAGGPVTDWRLYEVMYGERYMDTPQENPEGYKNNTIANSIDKLKAKTLLIHGYQDGVVVPQHHFELMKAATDKGIILDAAFYPGHEHNVIGIDRAHLIRRIKTYLDDNL